MSKSKEEIKKIFSSIALKYDRANRAITLGMDRGWRKKLVRWSAPIPSAKVLDCATGTGDLALEFQKQLNPQSHITGVDFCKEMLDQAEKKTKNIKNIHFQQADVEELPFADHSFDICSIAYGLRNMKDPIKALKEMARVLKPGGVLIILETGQPGILKPFFYLYFRYIVPFVGGKVTGQASAYKYLQESSLLFPSRKNLLKIMKKTGFFQKYTYKTLFLGAGFLYKAQKVE